MNIFDSQKKLCLSSLDLSRKGSIDDPIVGLVAFINERPNYFTTSSCSGRIIVVDNESDGTVKKLGCKWLLTSHTTVTSTELNESLTKSEGNAVFKFEPFVMHVQCRTLDDAQRLLSCAVASGYRNSGISAGNKGKYITAIRSTHSLEVPLSQNGVLLVDQRYLEFLVTTANKKMSENLQRIERLFQGIRDSIQHSNDPSSKPKRRERQPHITKDKDQRSPNTKTKPVQDLNSNSNVDPEDLIPCTMFDGELET